MPHFQIGLWGTHLFIILAVIYENPDKKGIAERLHHEIGLLTGLPEDYIVSGDHMKPEAALIQDAGTDGVIRLLDRLGDVKKAEFLVGRHLSREEAVQMTEKEFFAYADATFETLLPVYEQVIGQ